jgi:hypothetical protein
MERDRAPSPFLFGNRPDGLSPHKGVEREDRYEALGHLQKSLGERLALLAPQSHEQFVRSHLVVLEIEDRLTAGREAIVIERVTFTICGTRGVRRTARQHTPDGLPSEPHVPAPPPGRDVGSAPA